MSSSKVEIETLDCARFLGEITKGYRGWWYPGLMGLRGQSKSTGSEKAERLTPRNGGQLLRGWNSDFGNWSTLFETTKPARDRLDLDCCFSFGQQRLKRFDELKLIPIFFLSFFDRIVNWKNLDQKLYSEAKRSFRINHFYEFQVLLFWIKRSVFPQKNQSTQNWDIPSILSNSNYLLLFGIGENVARMYSTRWIYLEAKESQF